MDLPTLADIQDAQSVIYRHMPPTPQYSWPLLNERVGTETWVKHENHTPVGAFKIRGALVYLDWLKQTHPQMHGVVAATKGNFGQGVGAAARVLGLKAVIVVPHGNNKEQNRAILAQGAELLEHGNDFQESLEFAASLARERQLEMVDSFHRLLVAGTGCYALEFFSGTPPLDVVYVPIGLGSSICGMAAARNAMGVSTLIVGVVAEAAPAYALSVREHRVVSAPAETGLADGLACRTPNASALEAIWKNVDRVIEVSENEIADGMRAFHEDTHNIAEGAGAAALAGALKERGKFRWKRAGIVLTGGNVDRETFASVLSQGKAVERN